MNEDAHLKVNVRFGRPSSSDPVDPTPFHMLFIGDFGQEDSHPIEVDIDHLDAVIGRLRPQVKPSGEASDPVNFERLQDFHPDRLLEKMDGLREVMDLRSQLQSVHTFEAAANQIKRGRLGQAWKVRQQESIPPSQTQKAPSLESPPASTSSASDIERLLGRRPLGGADRAQAIADDLIGNIVGTSSPSRELPAEKDALQATIDLFLSEKLRNLLHLPSFQALESHWRGLEFLLDRLETGPSLKVFLLNHSPEALHQEMADPLQVTESTFYRTVVAQTVDTPGAVPWSLVGLLHPVEADPQGLTTWGRCLTLARAAGTPLIASAGQSLFQVHSEPRWNELRRQPEAALGGLLCGQFLLRRPYGQASDPLEKLSFEEIENTPEPADYLWGSPVWILACLIGQAFAEARWNLRQVLGDTLTEMPTHYHRQSDGQAREEPNTFPAFGESEVAALHHLGLMPIHGMRHRNVIRLSRFQSMAEPGSPLRARW